MAWVRIHDQAMTHPKIVGLSDKAFRLWVWGLSYCQLHLTDGLIPDPALPARFKRAVPDLEANGLWERIEAFGHKVHDYLDWNDSKELILKKRNEAKERIAAARVRANTSREHSANAPPRTSSDVLRGVVLKKEEREETIETRAGKLLDAYAGWFFKHLGARLRLLRNSLEFSEACQLCELWDDKRLERLAEIILTTDDPFIAGTDRSFKIFAMKASWADARLAAVERAS